MKTMKAMSARAFLLLILFMLVSLGVGNAAPRDEAVRDFHPAEILAKAHEFDVGQIKVEGKITKRGGKFYFPGLRILCKHNAEFSKWLVKNYNLTSTKLGPCFERLFPGINNSDFYDSMINTRKCGTLEIFLMDDKKEGSCIISFNQFAVQTVKGPVAVN